MSGLRRHNRSDAGVDDAERKQIQGALLVLHALKDEISPE
jgi:hypothetical protein